MNNRLFFPIKTTPNISWELSYDKFIQIKNKGNYIMNRFYGELYFLLDDFAIIIFDLEDDNKGTIRLAAPIQNAGNFLNLYIHIQYNNII